MNLNFKSCGRKENLNVEKNLAVGSRIDFLGRSTLALGTPSGCCSCQGNFSSKEDGGPQTRGKLPALGELLCNLLAKGPEILPRPK